MVTPSRPPLAPPSTPAAQRAAALQLIAGRYAEVHGATISALFDELLTEPLGTGEPAAVCGYRRAKAGPLFLESYLDEPVETVLSLSLGRTVARGDVVEIGNLAATNAGAMVSLWARAANDLAGSGEIAVAVLTLPLRRMFGRLGINLIEIAPARPERLGEDAVAWGSYYQRDPRVCAGLIAEGSAQLRRFAPVSRGRCA